MLKKSDVVERWGIGEGIYLPKEENLEKLGQFLPISLLNIDGKMILSIIAKRIIEIIWKNR